MVLPKSPACARTLEAQFLGFTLGVLCHVLGWGSSTPFKAVRNFLGKLLWAVEPGRAQEGATIAFDILHILFCQCHNGVCKEETSDADGRGERVLNVFLFRLLLKKKAKPKTVQQSITISGIQNVRVCVCGCVHSMPMTSRDDNHMQITTCLEDMNTREPKRKGRNLPSRRTSHA